MGNELAMDNVFTAEENNVNNTNNKLVVNDKAKESLLSATKWIKFLAIMQVIMIVFLIMLGIFGGFAIPFFGTFFSIIYIITGLISIYPTSKMFKHCKKTREALLDNNDVIFTEGMHEMRKLFKFYVIYTMASILFTFIMFIVGLTASINLMGSAFKF